MIAFPQEGFGFIPGHIYFNVHSNLVQRNICLFILDAQDGGRKTGVKSSFAICVVTRHVTNCLQNQNYKIMGFSTLIYKLFIAFIKTGTDVRNRTN
jgi:hypothetical protein